jgi:hypothetical protein
MHSQLLIRAVCIEAKQVPKKELLGCFCTGPERESCGARHHQTYLAGSQRAQARLFNSTACIIAYGCSVIYIDDKFGLA